MERTLTSALRAWKEQENRKPLILRGVRQCGKTYLLKQFAASCYRDCAYFNFEQMQSLKALFERDYDVSRILFELGLLLGRTIQPEETLIIFDEVQECSRALTSLKYFCEDAPAYHICCAGSHLGLAIHENTSFPVGKADFLTLYPMSFPEFVAACSSENLSAYLLDFNGSGSLPEAIAEKLEDLLKQYYFTGGMPEVVEVWRNTHNMEKVESTQQAIINSYELDFAKHAPSKDFPKLMAIWQCIPEQLAKANTKFFFSHVKQGWRAKDLEDALQWLIAAGLVYKVRKVEKPLFPLSAYADDTSFKIYMADVGLLRMMAHLPYELILDRTPYYREFKGSLTENYVLGELVKSLDLGEEDIFYWSSGNVAEVDFVVPCGYHIIPIEVKSEQSTKSRSLAEYRKKYNPAVAVKTSMMNKVEGGSVCNIPLYLMGNMQKLISL